MASLADVERWGELVTIGCNLCRSRRHYRPVDLRTIFGDLPLDQFERRIRCDACDRRDYMTVRTWRPIGEEWKSVVVRRLVRVDVVRRPVWQDEKAE